MIKEYFKDKEEWDEYWEKLGAIPDDHPQEYPCVVIMQQSNFGRGKHIDCYECEFAYLEDFK